MPIWTLSWFDEFNTPANTPPSAVNWNYDLTNNGGWGNGELQYYTNRTDNSRTDGLGNLIIEAKAESYMGSNYTSARLKTQGKFSQTYGRFEARMRLTYSQAIWPAFWMLGTNIGSVGWPACGEIDIMENVGFEPNITHGTIHGPGYSGGAGIGAAYNTGSPVSSTYHLYAVEWEPNIIRWYVDEVLFQTRTPADLGGDTWVFTAPQFMILNVAVGGAWPGYPDGTTVLPQQMLVDYVRVYTRNTTQVPYSGAALPIPGTIQAEQFDDGGEGVSYHDNSVMNNGTTRTSDAVDLEATADAGGGYNLGWTEAGEWMEYSVNVAASGTYALDMRVAMLGAGGTVRFQVDGVNLTGSTFNIPDTGGWQTWVTLPAQNVTLSAGNHILRLIIDSAGAGGVGNINWFRFTALTTPTFTPTRTASPTATRSPTPSPTRTATQTATRTASPSASPSPTSSRTPTPSSSPSRTATPSPSQTLLQSATPTVTATLSSSASATETEVPAGSTPTATSSFSPTATQTQTGTLTPTSSVCATVTTTASPTGTATLSASPSATLTPSPSATGSFTSGPTSSATAAPVLGAPAAGPLEIRASLPLPNPQPGPRISLALNLSAACDSLRLALYSSAHTLVWQGPSLGPGAAGWGQAHFDAPELAQGLYYFRVTAERGGEKARSRAGKIVILK